MATWEIVGGADKGGIIVREGQDLKSALESERLATKALVQELELIGDRLHYRLLKGTGPPEGWISIKISGKDLAIPKMEAGDLLTGPASPVDEIVLKTSNHMKLSSGTLMPIVGLGTWKASPGEVETAVLEAIELGYRHIDCARIYQNEGEVGKALKEAQARGLVRREELFITTKLWTSMHGAAKVSLGFQQSLKKLDCGYIDLYLIHCPAFPKPLPPLEDTWKGMEKLVDDGKCRAIGVSNFSIKKLERILADARIRPAVNQVEMHPYLPQQALLDFCRRQEIVITAFSPLGSADSAQEIGHAGKSLLEDSLINDIAKRLQKTPAQVLLRWGVQRGTVVIPKSVKRSRIEENFAIFDWELPEVAFQEINGISRRERFISMRDCLSAEGPFMQLFDIWDDLEGLPSE